MPFSEFLAVPGLSLGLFFGHFVDTNLVKIPGQMLVNEVPFRPSYYQALNVTQALGQTGPVTWAFDSSFLRHTGKQQNYELTAGISPQYRWRIPPVGSSLDLAFVEGISYAFGDPVVEKGVNGQKDDYVYLQNHLAFEIGLHFDAVKNLSFPIRLHHRSGVYGVFGPRGIGSNFLSLGVRWLSE